MFSKELYYRNVDLLVQFDEDYASFAVNTSENATDECL